MQRNAAEQRAGDDAPQLTVDAAILLVDTSLHDLGSTQACTRDEVVSAFAWLESPNVGIALRDGDGLIVRRSLSP